MLRRRFGRPDQIIRTLTDNVRELPPLATDNLEHLIEFGTTVENLVEHIKAARQEAHLSNPTLLQELVRKLPTSLKLQWSAYKANSEVVTLCKFGEFMSTLVEMACEVIDNTNEPSHTASSRNKKNRYDDKGFVQTHRQESEIVDKESALEARPPKVCVVCKKMGHRVADCEVFQSYSYDDKLRTVQQHSLCRTCLNYHGKWTCKSWRGCGMPGCRLRHHTLIHPPVTSNHTCTTRRQGNAVCGPLFRILPVTIVTPTKSLSIFAFIDEGSSLSLIESAVVDQLALKGPVEPLHLQWTGNVKRNEPKSQRIDITVAGAKKSTQFKLTNVRTVENLLLPQQTLAYRELAKKFPHLKGLPIEDYENVEPKLLIGLQNLHLTVPLKIREGCMGDPIATKCRLGWSVYGGNAESHTPRTVCHFHFDYAVDPDQELNDIVREYFLLDEAGITSSFSRPESDEEVRAKHLLKNTTRRVSDGFETGLLWRHDKVIFPDSYPMAFRRLQSLERRFNRDPSLYERVRHQIQDYLQKGYARLLTREDVQSADPERIWYIPLGVVTNPKKPNKLRLIWDAAAKANGTSLNSNLLKGPDMITSLPTVLSRFRQFPVALTGDIKEMFHRIKIIRSDQNSQRFLWRNFPNEKPQTYVMQVATFGATCSPCSAQYVKNVNANEFIDRHPKAVKAITENHYVDDYLDSFKTVQEAIQVGSEVKMIHKNGGFEIRNFLSNSRVVLEGVNESVSGECKELNLETSCGAESVLGMKWLPKDDYFTYTLSTRDDLRQIMLSTYVPTKREVLRVTMSLFDPLGLIAYVIIHGRILMQNIWSSGADWDDKINSTLFNQWRQWITLLSSLELLRIPRCLFPSNEIDDLNTLQVHIFVDASSSAYSAVGYFRIDGKGGPHVSLVAAKTKVAPLKAITIPKLELYAAVLGTLLMNSICSRHTLTITKRFLWTDSSTVVAWIQSKQRKYTNYVAIRVEEILATTNVEELRWISTKNNVADDATRWGKGPNLKLSSRWFNGPEYLHKDESRWPQNASNVINIEPLMIHQHTISFQLVELRRFSRWERLLHTQAYVLRFIDNIRRKQRKESIERGNLLQDELIRAENILLKQSQAEMFSDEIALLESSKGPPEKRHPTVSKSSIIVSRWPFMDSRVRKPDDETLETIMLEAEAMINTRPLTYIPLESADQESLTPNHFLLGSSSGIKQLPVNPVDCRGTLRNSWKLVQFINDQLWRRWIKEYVPVITRRCKWFKDVREIKVGDLVLVVDENIRNKWMRGRVVEVLLGKDGRVRQAVVKTISGLFRRAVTSLALLDVVDDSETEPTDNSDDHGSRAGECNVEPYNPAIG
ncbi:uncharacterized protein LOC129720124 [Wyeomyia smithii]|uniref:uncharacterized protein LOC129720124 n=1 Tax=Wyeomyia smithii TaxID=174621 RepID=UPI002467B987|nr:uncharacterized protein LOC129720124 [Wyeomyia smithii]